MQVRLDLFHYLVSLWEGLNTACENYAAKIKENAVSPTDCNNKDSSSSRSRERTLLLEERKTKSASTYVGISSFAFFCPLQLFDCPTDAEPILSSPQRWSGRIYYYQSILCSRQEPFLETGPMGILWRP